MACGLLDQAGIVPTLIGADGGQSGSAIIRISGGFWKPARNCAGTDGNPICAGSAQCCASVAAQRGGVMLGSLKEAGKNSST